MVTTQSCHGAELTSSPTSTVMTFPFPLRPTIALGLLCSSGLLGLSTLLTPTSSHAQTWGRPPYGPPPVSPASPFPGRWPQAPYGGSNNRWAMPNPNGQTVYDNDPSAWSVSEAEMAQRCNMGRLLGGLIGGGVGYATSRKDGRSWAVPLGALLGSQMGCNVGNGRGPVPW